MYPVAPVTKTRMNPPLVLATLLVPINATLAARLLCAMSAAVHCQAVLDHLAKLRWRASAAPSDHCAASAELLVHFAVQPAAQQGSQPKKTFAALEHDRLAFLAEASRILASSLDYEETLSSIA